MEFVVFKIEGDLQEYKLHFDFNRLVEAEAESGCNLMRALSGGEITAGQTRGVLFACLKTAHPQVLLAEAGELLSKDLNGVLDALAKALSRAKDTSDQAENVPEA